MAAAALVPASRALTLYDLEDNLAALLESVDTVEPEQEEEFLQAVRQAMTATVEKRNRVYQFLQHCKTLQDSCASEIRRLQDRKKILGNAEERMRDRIKSIIEGLGQDPKGKYKKLECDYATFSLRSLPGSVEIGDEAKVPDMYKRITVCLPLEAWKEVKDAIHDESAAFSDPEFLLEQQLQRAEESATIRVDEALVKAAITAGEDVPGADIAIGAWTLQVK